MSSASGKDGPGAPAPGVRTAATVVAGVAIVTGLSLIVYLLLPPADESPPEVARASKAAGGERRPAAAGGAAARSDAGAAAARSDAGGAVPGRAAEERRGEGRRDEGAATRRGESAPARVEEAGRPGPTPERAPAREPAAIVRERQVVDVRLPELEWDLPQLRAEASEQFETHWYSAHDLAREARVTGEGEDHVALKTNGSLRGEFVLENPATEVTIWAWGEVVGKEGARARVLLNGEVMGEFETRSAELDGYTFAVHGEPTELSVEVRFLNDYFGGRQMDRNLYVHGLTITTVQRGR